MARVARFLNPGLALGLLLFSLIWVFWTLSSWYRLHLHLPWRDTFVVLSNIIPMLENGTSLDNLASWFEPHYAAHRIALPRALIAIDLAWFRGQNHLIYSAGWLALVASLSVVLVPAWRELRTSRSAWVLLLATALCFMLGPSQLWNILNPINISWHLSFAFSALAFWCLLRRGAEIRARDLSMAWCFALLAAFSSFGGLLACLLLPLVAVRGPRRYLLASLVIALFFTLWYLQGIASDAAVAARWDQGNNQVIEQMRESGEAAMAANTLPRIAWRALALLSWPLSEQWPIIAPLLALGAVLVLPWAGLLWFRSLQPGGQPFSNWRSLCLFLAILSVGIALSTQLGRMMEQPNYAHGPSFERYQTVVAIFWMCTLALWISFNYQTPLRLLAVSSSTVLVTPLLMVPGGHYLQQEIDSNHYAARLYGQGEIEALRPPLDKRRLRFRPEYLFSFDEFFLSRGLAYRVSAALAPATEQLTPCFEIIPMLELDKTAEGDRLQLRLQLPGQLFTTTRELWLASSTRLSARLYPQHLGDYSPLQLSRAPYNQWLGTVLPAQAGDTAQTLMARTPLGDRALCSLMLPLTP